MKTWEYRRDRINYNLSVMDHLKELGELGWELVAMSTFNPQDKAHLVHEYTDLYFKRERRIS
jgi:hypothetical protein